MVGTIDIVGTTKSEEALALGRALRRARQR